MIRHLCGAVVLLLIIAPPGAGQDAEPAGKSLKLATYNVKNLLDVFDDPYTRDEITNVKSREDIEAIAQSIREMDADIVALTEIENEGVLRAMVFDYLADLGYDQIAVGQTNDGRGIRVGLISRYPIDSITSHRLMALRHEGSDKIWRFARDLTRFQVRVTEDRSLDLYVVHFKSRRSAEGDKNSTKWRTSEAKATFRIIDDSLAKQPDRWAALIGDLNATRESAAMNLLLSPGLNGEPILHDVHAGLPAEKRITYPHKVYASTLDYIMVSPALHKRYLKDSAQVGGFLTGTDHRPISAAFQID